MPDKAYSYSEQSPLYTNIAEPDSSLTAPRPRIRVVKLRPGYEYEQLECNLYVRDLRSSDTSIYEPYHSLSYHWGPQGGECFVRILDGGEAYRLPIGRNLDTALRQLRWEDEPRHLWVDSLCIDQSNMREKSSQIPLMNDIYNRAECVHVSLGEEAENSSEAMDFIIECGDLDKFDSLVIDTSASTKWAALLALMRRPWFSRRWIIQEIAFARKAEVHCGPKSLPWEDFAHVLSMVAERPKELRKLFRESITHRNHPDYLGDIGELGAIRLADLSDNLFQKADDSVIKHFTLEELMASLTAFEASDPRDLLYALLWLASDAKPVNKNAVIKVGRMQSQNSPSGLTGPPQIATDPPSSMGVSSDVGAIHNSQPAFSHSHSQGNLTYTEPSSSVPSLVLNDKSQSDDLSNGLIAPPEPPEGSNASKHPQLQLDTRVQLDTGHLRPPSGNLSAVSASTSADSSTLTDEQRTFRVASGVLDVFKKKHFVVDYDKDVLEVCIDFLKFAIRRSKSLDILCIPWGPNDEGLPTWIPQRRDGAFTADDRGTYRRKNADPLVGRLGYTNGGRKQYRASKNMVAVDWKLGRGDGRTLSVLGFVLDEVKDKTGPAHGVIPVDWLRFGGWEDLTKRPPDVFWRTLVGNRDSDGNLPSPHWSKSCQNAVNKSGKDGHIDTNHIRHDCSTFVDKFLERVQQVVWRRRLITLQRQASHKCLGLAPEKTKKGDLICILYGCSVPVVLREMDGSERTAKRRKYSNTVRLEDGENANSKHFRFIGECYIHGMMLGEAFRIKKESDTQNKHFNLR